MNDGDLQKFAGKRVRVKFKDGRRSIGLLQRDQTQRCWELLRADVDRAKFSPPGVGEILFLQDLESVEEFNLRQ